MLRQKKTIQLEQQYQITNCQKKIALKTNSNEIIQPVFSLLYKFSLPTAYNAQPIKSSFIINHENYIFKAHVKWPLDGLRLNIRYIGIDSCLLQ